MKWLMNNSIVFALVCGAFFSIGYWLAGWFTTYRWMRIRRRIRCLFNKHDPGPVREEVGGRRVQRCDWCDKVVREYVVTLSNLEKEKIRRIY